jgi:AcrR family transcriptional regulator
MAYDSAATRTRLLDAAYAEFVERGLAGARVDRIASAASANKQAIYAYFGSKDALFDAVLESRLLVLADLVPFTADDLPGYAGALFDRLTADPGLLRLTQWKALERPEASPSELAAHLAKAGDLAEAHGAAAERGMDALMIALAIVSAWSTTAPAVREGAPVDGGSVDGGGASRGGGDGGIADGGDSARLARHRAAVVTATAAITAALLDVEDGGADR